MPGTYIKSILCPKHQEKTPSCAIYDDGYYCFGCGSKGTLEEIGLEEITTKIVVKEDLNESIRRIIGLPIAEIRGLSLHWDTFGYYILWPDNSFYKKRNNEGIRYYTPKGHSVPKFILKGDNEYLIIVEGEINALSLRAAGIDSTIISPGSATKSQVDSLYTEYKNILIISDNDVPGKKFTKALKNKLILFTPYVNILLVDEDCNDVLVKYGKQKLKEMVLQAWL